MEQEEINRKLREITKTLKSISSIGNNYMEYISALMYVICYDRNLLKKMLKTDLQDVRPIIYEIDNKISEIRSREKSYRLFDIRFSEVINSENDVIFKKVIVEINDLVSKLENLEDKGQNLLAESFEYIIMKAAQNGELISKNKEFYTPKGVVKALVKLLDIQKNMAIYNPACGTGNFITESAKYGKIFAFGEENDSSNYNICITNLFLHGVKNKRIQEKSIENVQDYDIALANPPFASDEINNNYQKIYYDYGISNTASSYTKFLVMMLEKTHPFGKIGIILPQGFLFKKTVSEYRVRRELIEKNYIDAVIALPEKLFYKTRIPVVILLVNKARSRKEVLFIDASREYISKKKTNILSVENQDKILDTYKQYKDTLNYSHVADFKEIANNDFDLDVKKYVKVKNETEHINHIEIEKNLLKLEQEKIDVQDKISKLLEDIL